MKIATWNVNSIRARMERLRAWLAAQAPDVLCLQETKVEDNAFPALELESLGYHVAAHGQKTYNGVAVLARQPLDDIVRGFGDGVEDAQARFLVVRVGAVRVGSLYVPNGQAVGTDKFMYKLAWLRALASLAGERTPMPGSRWFFAAISMSRRRIGTFTIPKPGVTR